MFLRTVYEQNREIPMDIRISMSGKITTSSKKGLVSTSRTYASPKGTGPGTRRSKRPLSACHTRHKGSIETSQIRLKVEFGTCTMSDQ